MRVFWARLNPIVEEVEREIARYIGTRYSVLCSSGRTAIRFSLLALGIGYGDEVIIPDFACQIVPITVFCAGAVPRFCDVERETLTLSRARLPEVLKSKTKAVIFIHPFGFPTDPSPIIEISEKRGIAFIDDAAQALGASVRGKKAGSFGNVGILTFNKSLNVDLGAAATTNDEELAAKIRLIREKYETKSFVASLAYRAMEFSRLKSREITKMIFRSDKYVGKLRNVTLAKKHFRNVKGWVEAGPHVLELWRTKALTSSMINQLMIYGNTYHHRRKMEKTEIISLKHEIENLEKRLQHPRELGKMYDELLEERRFSKIAVPMNSAPSYLRYPILFSDKKLRSICSRELRRAGFVVEVDKPLHKSPFFDWMNRNSNFKESVYVSEHILPLPVQNAKMNSKKVEKVSSIVNFVSSR
jgi:dTDP-4-amino-4,6-dideoxygalactose transaminase